MNPYAAALLDALNGWSSTPDNGWEKLQNLLDRHAATEFGRAHSFASIRSPQDFRDAIAPMNYEDYSRWIERAANGVSGVLACEEPFGFERTSGSSGAAKWIPITAGLQGEFARGLAAWFGGWQRRCPEVFKGRAYWSISPPGMAPETTPAGLPVGMTSDAAYFPEAIGSRLADWLVLPKLGGDPAAVFDETAEALLATPDLSLVSVWSPTFLLGIDAALRRLREGKTWREIWPRLALVSCWADASSAPWIPVLRERLGGIPVEPKGLLATEGITSLPDGFNGMPRLAAECHYHEFLNEAGDFVEIGDLTLGRDYEVLLTTAGGLFRYASGDRVRVTAKGADGLPRLRFIGRAGTVSDLVGEKLHEDQVLAALVRCRTRGFAVAVPERPGYDVWLEDAGRAGDFEILLRQNPYFAQALALRQLAPLRIHRLRGSWLVKLSASLAARRGCRIGDVKFPVLISNIRPVEVASWLD